MESFYTIVWLFRKCSFPNRCCGAPCQGFSMIGKRALDDHDPTYPATLTRIENILRLPPHF
jgi:hypothetical protein